MMMITSLFGNTVDVSAAKAGKTIKTVKVVIDKKDATKKTYSLPIGVSKNIVVTISPSSAKKSVAFKSSNTRIVTVDSKGKVTAKAVGKVKITITIKGKDGKTTKKYVTINVPAVPVSNITLDQQHLTMNPEQKVKLQATVSPKNATNKTIKWSSSNPVVADVSSTGEVTALSAGTTFISAISSNNRMAMCQVDVKEPVESVELDASGLSMYPTQEIRLNATVLPLTASDKSVVWESADPTVATVDDTGKVTAVAVGDTTITVTTNDGAKTATCQIEVKKRIKNISVSAVGNNAVLDNDQYKIFAGYSETFKIDTKEFENAQFQIKSSDEERLKVTDYGDGTFKIDTFVSGVASVSITVQSAVDTASFNMNFVIGVDAVALRAVKNGITLKDDAYYFDIAVDKLSGAAITEKDLEDGVVELQGENTKYVFEAMYVKDSYQDGNITFQVNKTGYVVLSSGKASDEYIITGTSNNFVLQIQSPKVPYFQLPSSISVSGVETAEDGSARITIYRGDTKKFRACVDESAYYEQINAESSDNEAVQVKVDSIPNSREKEISVSASKTGTVELTLIADKNTEVTKKITVVVVEDIINLESDMSTFIEESDGNFKVTVSAYLDSKSLLGSDAWKAIYDTEGTNGLKLDFMKETGARRTVHMYCSGIAKSDGASGAEHVILTFRTLSQEDAKQLKTNNNEASGTYEVHPVETSRVKLAKETIQYAEAYASQTVEGYVVDEFGVPIPNITVTADKVSSETDQNGYYVIYLPKNGSFKEVKASPKGDDAKYFEVSKYTKTDISVGTKGKTVVNFVMESRERSKINIDGRVKNSTTYLSGATVEIQVLSELTGEWVTIGQAITNKEGQYFFGNSKSVATQKEDGCAFVFEDDLLDFGARYRILVKKELSVDNIDDVYDSKAIEILTNTTLARTNASDILLTAKPENYTRTENNMNYYELSVKWDMQTKHVKDRVTAWEKFTDSNRQKTDIRIQMINTSGVWEEYHGTKRPLVEKEFSYDDVINKIDPVNGTWTIDLKEEFFPIEQGAYPNMPEGTYFFIVNDGVNAITVYPATVGENGMVTVKDQTITLATTAVLCEKIPYINRVADKHTNTYPLFANQTQEEKNLYKITSFKEDSNAPTGFTSTVSEEELKISYDYYQIVDSKEVYIGTTDEYPFVIQKDDSNNLVARTDIQINQLKQTKHYTYKTSEDWKFAEKKADSQDSQGVEQRAYIEYLNDELIGTADLNQFIIPSHAFKDAPNEIYVSAYIVNGTRYEYADTIQNMDDQFIIDVSDNEALRNLQTDEYNVAFDIDGYYYLDQKADTTGYTESFGLVDCESAEVLLSDTTRYDKKVTDYIKANVKIKNSSSTDDKYTGDIVALLYCVSDGNVCLSGVAQAGKMGNENYIGVDYNTGDLSVEFTDGINANLDENNNGNYVIVVRGTNLQNSITKDVAVNQTYEINARYMYGGSQISAKVTQEIAVIESENHGYTSNYKPLDDTTQMWASEHSDYYIDPDHIVYDESRYSSMRVCGRYANAVEFFKDTYQADGVGVFGKFIMKQDQTDAYLWLTSGLVTEAVYQIETLRNHQIVYIYTGKDPVTNEEKFLPISGQGRTGCTFKIVNSENKVNNIRPYWLKYTYDSKLYDENDVDVIILKDARGIVLKRYYVRTNHNQIYEDRGYFEFLLEDINKSYKFEVYHSGSFVTSGTIEYDNQTSVAENNDGTRRVHVSVSCETAIGN